MFVLYLYLCCICICIDEGIIAARCSAWPWSAVMQHERRRSLIWARCWQDVFLFTTSSISVFLGICICISVSTNHIFCISYLRQQLILSICMGTYLWFAHISCTFPGAPTITLSIEMTVLMKMKLIVMEMVMIMIARQQLRKHKKKGIFRNIS